MPTWCPFRLKFYCNGHGWLAGRVLRLETTANDVSFFKHHRKVEHKDGHTTREVAIPLNSWVISE